MKTRLITVLLLIMIFAGCKNDADNIIGTYSSMHFVHQGGGAMDFRLSPTNNPNQLQAIVSNYNYRDTTIRIVIDNNVDSVPYFIAFKKALSSEIDIAGDFQQSTLPTGTWAYVYVSRNGKDTEVTNRELRSTLLQFEQLVRNKIQ